MAVFVEGRGASASGALLLPTLDEPACAALRCRAPALRFACSPRRRRSPARCGRPASPAAWPRARRSGPWRPRSVARPRLRRAAPARSRAPAALPRARRSGPPRRLRRERPRLPARRSWRSRQRLRERPRPRCRPAPVRSTARPSLGLELGDPGRRSSGRASDLGLGVDGSGAFDSSASLASSSPTRPARQPRRGRPRLRSSAIRAVAAAVARATSASTSAGSGAFDSSASSASLRLEPVDAGDSGG